MPVSKPKGEGDRGSYYRYQSGGSWVSPEGSDGFDLVEVSASGGVVAVDGEVEPGTEIELVLADDELEQPIELRGRVLWCRRGMHGERGCALGVGFTGIRSHDRQRLRRLPQFFDLTNVVSQPELVEMVPERLATRLRLVPFRLDRAGNTLHAATSVWLPSEALDLLQERLSCKVRLHFAPASDVAVTARALYATPAVEGTTEGDAPAALNRVLSEGRFLRASDVHIQPGTPCQVRYRVDGRLTLGPTLAEPVYKGVVSRLKVLSRLDIAERRAAQDGQFAWAAPDGDVWDVRVATVPSILGEHASLRLFGPGSRPQTLPELGLAPDQMDDLAEAVRKPHGIILVAGPTGGGKTTTLYACLREIDRTDNHIVTMEDPVEHRFPNITQIELHGHTKVTASNILRSVLRHDADVVVLGEIRDPETLALALQAGLSGQLVLGTMHAHDAVAAPARLLDMGAPPYVLATTLNLVVAQRLARRLCHHCREKVKLSGEAAAASGLTEGATAWEPRWCPKCNYSGYQGRIGVFETMVVTDAVRKAIMSKSGAAGLGKVAAREGMRTMAEQGARYISTGVTDAGELRRVLA
jgi:type II secretory ATPase GspE/PulE/Tfp pilus assembly ATPase PilB-like protein